jgi:hypothetical protein
MSEEDQENDSSKWISCGGSDHHNNDCYYCPSDHLVRAFFKAENPDPNALGCELLVSIDNPQFVSILSDSFNEFLSQEKLRKENFAEFLKVKIAKTHDTGN